MNDSTMSNLYDPNIYKHIIGPIITNDIRNFWIDLYNEKKTRVHPIREHFMHHSGSDHRDLWFVLSIKERIKDCNQVKQFRLGQINMVRFARYPPSQFQTLM